MEAPEELKAKFKLLAAKLVLDTNDSANYLYVYNGLYQLNILEYSLAAYDHHKYKDQLITVLEQLTDAVNALSATRYVTDIYNYYAQLLLRYHFVFERHELKDIIIPETIAEPVIERYQLLKRAAQILRHLQHTAETKLELTEVDAQNKMTLHTFREFEALLPQLQSLQYDCSKLQKQYDAIFTDNVDYFKAQYGLLNELRLDDSVQPHKQFFQIFLRTHIHPELETVVPVVLTPMEKLNNQLGRCQVELDKAVEQGNLKRALRYLKLYQACFMELIAGDDYSHSVDYQMAVRSVLDCVQSTEGLFEKELSGLYEYAAEYKHQKAMQLTVIALFSTGKIILDTLPDSLKQSKQVHEMIVKFVKTPKHVDIYEPTSANISCLEVLLSLRQPESAYPYVNIVYEQVLPEFIAEACKQNAKLVLRKCLSTYLSQDELDIDELSALVGDNQPALEAIKAIMKTNWIVSACVVQVSNQATETMFKYIADASPLEAMPRLAEKTVVIVVPENVENDNHARIVKPDDIPQQKEDPQLKEDPVVSFGILL